jgi:hypothetical protein
VVAPLLESTREFIHKTILKLTWTESPSIYY